MPLRSGKIRNESIKKRPYNKKKLKQQTQDDDGVGEDLQLQLVLDKSTEELNELDLTHDEYGREVPKNNVNFYAALDEENDLKGCLTEEEEIEEEEKQKQQNKRGKKKVFKPIDKIIVLHLKKRLICILD